MHPDSTYVELHAASAFSFLEGASLPETLVERAATLDIPAIALLDRNGVYGAPRFHARAIKKSVKAHIGAEVSVAGIGRRAQAYSWLPTERDVESPRLPLLCLSAEGYGNLCQMISAYKLRETGKSEGAATFVDLEQYSSGLVCLTGGDNGVLASALKYGGERGGRRLVEQLIAVFGKNNVYVEIQRHQQQEQEWRNQACLRIATSLNLPVVATNGVQYACREDRELQDVFTAIQYGKALDEAGCLLSVNSERHLRDSTCMMRLFHDIPHAIHNTVELSARLEFTLDRLGYEFPQYPSPDAMSIDSYLQHCVDQGLATRYGSAFKKSLLDKAKKQATYELDLIKRLGFSGYFLIVMDIVRYCAANDILVQGRGSAANSVVCYVLEITAVDPIAMELLFERFLSENRGEWPDIDLDLPSGEQREQVIRYVYEKYGESGAAMTANVITYRGKSAAREVGKALGFKNDVIDRLARLVGHWEWKGPTDTLAHHFRQADLDIQHPQIAKYLELTMRMQDLPRHLGQHSGGMVICQGS